MEEKEMEQLFRQHYLGMYQLAKSYLYDTEESKDVVSEVFASLAHSQKTMIPETTQQYLMTSVRNRCLNIIKQKKLRENILCLLPGVWEEKGSVSINGNNGTKIYIGDRQVQLSGDDLSTYLKGIRSENIDKIEIIAHPSAEYEADGQGGIIRILLKDQEQGSKFNLPT